MNGQRTQLYKRDIAVDTAMPQRLVPPIALTLLLLFAVMMAIGLGSVRIPLADVARVLFNVDPSPMFRDIVLLLRAPRVAVAGLVGAALAAALATGAAVSVSGVIGFVGLIVPHMLRLWLGSDMRVLLPNCALGGAAFLILADAFGRVAYGAVEIRVGIVTALFGAPFFLYLLYRHGRQWTANVG